ncbi:hypothetical protein LTR17_018738 [Elasticomyces elasticus]|nr:hypothetical protein LTR17_018738 [Elasticomyces elasticus]
MPLRRTIELSQRSGECLQELLERTEPAMTPIIRALARVTAILAASSGVLGLSNPPTASDVPYTTKAVSKNLDSSLQLGIHRNESKGLCRTVVKNGTSPATGASRIERNSHIVNCSATRISLLVTQQPSTPVIVLASPSMEQAPSNSTRSVDVIFKTQSTSFATIALSNGTNFTACPYQTRPTTSEIPQPSNASGQNTLLPSTVTITTTRTTTTHLLQTSSAEPHGSTNTLDLSEGWLTLSATILNLISGVALPTFQVALTWRQLGQLNSILGTMDGKAQV